MKGVLQIVSYFIDLLHLRKCYHQSRLVLFGSLGENICFFFKENKHFKYLCLVFEIALVNKFINILKGV